MANAFKRHSSRATIGKQYQAPSRFNHMYKTRGWKHMRAAQLAAHPLCRVCERKGDTTVATVVDHIKPHGGDEGLFYDRSNLQSLCPKCHQRKTNKEKKQ